MKKLFNLLFIAIMAMSFTACTNVEPTEEGFMYRPYSSGIDTTTTYTGTVEAIAPWNDMITTPVIQKSRNYASSVMDKNGTEINVNISVNFNAMKGKTAKLYLKHGASFEESFIDVKVKGAIKNVIGRYTYEEVYSTKREALETEIDDMLQTEFAENYITYNFNEIADVNLPDNIAAQITAKETQKQRNLTAKEKELEEEYLANALVKKSTGQADARRVTADAQAYEYKQKQKNLTDKMIQQQFIDKWNGVLPVYGTTPELFKTVSSKK